MYLQSSLLFVVDLVSGGIFTICFVGSFPAVVVVLSVGPFRAQLFDEGLPGLA